MRGQIFAICMTGLFLAGCAMIGSNARYEKRILYRGCDESSFLSDLQKIKKKDDVIYVGLNAGSAARACKDYKQSNEFFDAAEDSYKYDVDLERGGIKAGKSLIATLVSDSLVDYDGSLHERIMVNVYKGLNFMALNDYENARVEFNRAQLRQEKAKEYFKKQIENSKNEIKKVREDPKQPMNMAVNIDAVNSHYERLFIDFASVKEFTNPYASYLSSVFYFLEGDYAKAEDKFKEIAALNTDSKDFSSLAQIYKTAAEMERVDQKYIFLAYEDGFGAIRDNFILDLPFMVDEKIASAHVSFPMIQKREPSFGDVFINGQRSFLVSDFDQIVAAEFKAELPGIITKSIASAIAKTVTSVAVAKNDSTGGWLSLGTSLIMDALNESDARGWMSLPKTARMAILPNTGSFTLTATDGSIVAQSNLDVGKNVLVVVRSYQRRIPPDIFIMER